MDESSENSADMPVRQGLTFDLDVDICVIGGGLAGLTMALESARQGASVALLEGRPESEALAFACAAGALATTRPGAQTALPWRAEVEAAMTDA